MDYKMAATVVTLNDLDGHSPVAGFFKCNPSNICAAFYSPLIASWPSQSTVLLGTLDGETLGEICRVVFEKPGFENFGS